MYINYLMVVKKFWYRHIENVLEMEVVVEFYVSFQFMIYVLISIQFNKALSRNGQNKIDENVNVTEQ